MLETFITAGIVSAVLSAVIAGLISFRQQSHFYDKQEKRGKEKEEIEMKKKHAFILETILHESKYNLSIINEMLDPRKTGTTNSYILFNTNSYQLFASDIALLGKNTSDKINEVYLQLFNSNSEIEGEFRINTTNQRATINPFYKCCKSQLDSFIAFIEEKQKTL